MIFLASLFYRHKRYHIVLEQVSYVLSRAVKTEASALKTSLKPVFNEIPAMFILNFFTNYVIIFEHGSRLIPDELEIEVTNHTPFGLDIIILAYFLKFLSNYH